MEQYCAYENLGSGRHVYPYLINLQHPVANVLKHAIVAPAIRLDQLPGGKPPVNCWPGPHGDDSYDDRNTAKRVGRTYS